MKTRAVAALCFIAPFVLTGVSRAADIAPAQGYRHEFRSGASVTVYYTTAEEGFHVTATMQSDDTDHQSVSRVTLVLTPGQSIFLSVPAAAGSPIDTVAIKRTGDVLSLTPSRTRTAGN